ncbi:hypothetical protein DTO217A2_5113 [Paecilomyces variotii]|nr:hypothetical protein DTO217A2_5113 [Paecilomyces variotii]
MNSDLPVVVRMEWLDLRRRHACDSCPWFSLNRGNVSNNNNIVLPSRSQSLLFFQSEIRNGRRVTEPRPVEVAVQISISGRVAHPETEVRQVLSVASRYQFEATDF